jgi:hypothetical protein
MRIACLVAALLLLPATAFAQASAADIAYCNRLADVFERYLGRSANSPVYETPSSSLDSQIAAEQCRQGKPAQAIPVLERVLRGNGFTLPPRG